MKLTKTMTISSVRELVKILHVMQKEGRKEANRILREKNGKYGEDTKGEYTFVNQLGKSVFRLCINV
jgi:hypothetical protein